MVMFLFIEKFSVIQCTYIISYMLVWFNRFYHVLHLIESYLGLFQLKFLIMQTCNLWKMYNGKQSFFFLKQFIFYVHNINYTWNACFICRKIFFYNKVLTGTFNEKRIFIFYIGMVRSSCFFKLYITNIHYIVK